MERLPTMIGVELGGKRLACPIFPLLNFFGLIPATSHHGTS
jgi:hypothetical protein